jgi:hypothetical protein
MEVRRMCRRRQLRWPYALFNKEAPLVSKEPKSRMPLLTHFLGPCTVRGAAATLDNCFGGLKSPEISSAKLPSIESFSQTPSRWWPRDLLPDGAIRDVVAVYLSKSTRGLGDRSEAECATTRATPCALEKKSTRGVKCARKNLSVSTAKISSLAFGTN